MDNYGNLFYIDTVLNAIMKISSSDLLYLQSEPNNSSLVLNPIFVYGENTTEAMNSPEGLFISGDYLYWTNSENGTNVGAIHKAFTLPFVEAKPISNF